MKAIETIKVHYAISMDSLGALPDVENDIAEQYRFELVRKALSKGAIKPNKEYVIRFEQERLISDDYPRSAVKVFHYLHVQEL